MRAVAESNAGAGKLVAFGASGTRILVVDDNIDAADSLSQMLQLVGYSTKVAYEGVTAVELAELWHPGVVLLDLGLPNISGHEVARRLRREAWGRSMRLIAITGWGQEDDRRKSRDAGFDEHLTKPVDPDALLGLITRLVRGAA
jgi:CheY-like chemotaxis protein